MVPQAVAAAFEKNMDIVLTETQRRIDKEIAQKAQDMGLAGPRNLEGLLRDLFNYDPVPMVSTVPVHQQKGSTTELDYLEAVLSDTAKALDSLVNTTIADMDRVLGDDIAIQPLPGVSSSNEESLTHLETDIVNTLRELLNKILRQQQQPFSLQSVVDQLKQIIRALLSHLTGAGGDNSPLVEDLQASVGDLVQGLSAEYSHLVQGTESVLVDLFKNLGGSSAVLTPPPPPAAAAANQHGASSLIGMHLALRIDETVQSILKDVQDYKHAVLVGQALSDSAGRYMVNLLRHANGILTSLEQMPEAEFLHRFVELEPLLVSVVNALQTIVGGPEDSITRAVRDILHILGGLVETIKHILFGSSPILSKSRAIISLEHLVPKLLMKIFGKVLANHPELAPIAEKLMSILSHILGENPTISQEQLLQAVRAVLKDLSEIKLK